MSLIHRINKKIIAYLIGLQILALGILCLIPLSASLYYGEYDQSRCFALSVGVFLFVAGLLMYFCRAYHLPVSKRDGQIIIGLIWIITPLFGALPYLLNQNLFNLQDAVFESFSGFTTTGSTIVRDLDLVPRSLLIYRALTQWLGGLGFAVIIILALKSKAGGIMNIFNAEFSSVYKNKMYPHLSDTALRILFVYTGLTVLCFVVLCFGSMNLFQAFCHSLTTVATGGFSTQNNNIGAFQDSYTTNAITLMMFLSGTSYFVYVRCFKRDWKVFKDNQFLTYLGAIVSISALFVLYGYYNHDRDVTDNLGNAAFYVTSILTTTGFDIQAYNNHTFIVSALIFLMFIGGCSASSASGLKIIRVVQLYKYTRASMTKIFHPHAIIPVKYNGRLIAEEDLKSTFGFFFIYIIVFVCGVFALACFGNPFNTSITLSIANLGNIGPVVGGYLQGFTYASLNIASKGVLIVLMLMGRLEIYALLSLVSRSLWRRS